MKVKIGGRESHLELIYKDLGERKERYMSATFINWMYVPWESTLIEDRDCYLIPVFVIALAATVCLLQWGWLSCTDIIVLD